MIPTTKQIETEVKKLSKLKPLCPRASVFGDNHHEAIDAQIEVLEARGEIDESTVDERRDNGEWRDNVADAANEALLWMDGYEPKAPSANWMESIKLWSGKK